MITIQGVKIKDVSMSRDSDGKEKIAGNYELISSTDKVLAKQSFNDYNSVKFEPTGDTIKLMQQLWSAIKKDLEEQLGLQDE